MPINQYKCNIVLGQNLMVVDTPYCKFNKLLQTKGMAMNKIQHSELTHNKKDGSAEDEKEWYEKLIYEFHTEEKTHKTNLFNIAKNSLSVAITSKDGLT